MRRKLSRCRQLIEAGGYRGLDAEAVSHGLNAMIDGLWFDLLIDPDAVNAESAKAICRIFLGALFPKHFGPLAHRAGAGDRVPRRPKASRRSRRMPRPTPSGARRTAGASRSRSGAASSRRARDATKDLATAIGVTADTVRRLAENTEPSSWLLGRLMAALDPSFLVSSMPVETARRAVRRAAVGRQGRQTRDRAALELRRP